MKERANHSPAFKAKVALEAIRDEMTLAALSKERARAQRPCGLCKQLLETPWYGSRQMARHMQRNNHKYGRHRVRRLMRLVRAGPIYQNPNTSKTHP